MKKAIFRAMLLLAFVLFVSGHGPESVVRKFVRPGDHLSMDCVSGEERRFAVAHNRPISAQWENTHGQIIVLGKRLELRHVRESDSGIYRCKITKMAGSTVTTKTFSYEIIVGPGPSRTQLPDPGLRISGGSDNDIVWVWESDRVFLQCEAANWQAGRYHARWLRLAEDDLTSDKGEVAFASGILFFQSSSVAQAGRYRCVVQHNDDSEGSQMHFRIVQIIVQTQNLYVEVLPEDTLSPNGRVHRRCSGFSTSESSSNHHTFQWLGPKNQVVSETKELDLQIEGRGFHNGIYTCRVQVEYAEKTFEVETKIEGPGPSRTQLPDPGLRISGGSDNDIVWVWESDRVFLQCEAANWQAGRYHARWLRLAEDDLTSDKGEVAFASGILFFQSSSVAQAGRYRCVVQHNDDSEGSQMHSRIVQIIVQAQNLYVEVLPEETLSPNGRVHRRCSGFSTSESSSNHHTFQWLGPKNQVVSETKELDLQIEGRSFHNGIYTCRVQVEYAEKTFEVETKIEVKEQKKESSKQWDHFSSIEAFPKVWRLGNLFSLLCKVEPPLNYTSYQWLKDGVSHENGQILTFSSFSRSDAGVYTCEASGFDNDSYIHLIVKSDQRFGLVNSPSLEMSTGLDSRYILLPGQKLEIRCGIVDYSSRDFSSQNVEWFFNGEPVNTNGDLYSVRRFDLAQVSILTIEDAGNNHGGVYKCFQGTTYKKATVVIDKSYCEPVNTECRSFKGKNPSKRFINRNWLCDGENDCGNGFDEKNCENSLGECGGQFFRCRNGVMIPRGYVCDGNSDCPGREDEQQCRSPKIQAKRQETDGEYITISCIATAWPTPTIVWRFNSGCLPKIVYSITIKTMGCDTIISNLNITNTRETKGMYHCEAINIKSTSISEDLLFT